MAENTALTLRDIVKGLEDHGNRSEDAFASMLKKALPNDATL